MCSRRLLQPTPMRGSTNQSALTSGQALGEGQLPGDVQPPNAAGGHGLEALVQAGDHLYSKKPIGTVLACWVVLVARVDIGLQALVQAGDDLNQENRLGQYWHVGWCW